MSYAAAAAKNRLPESEQPHPDPNLLEGSHHSDESEHEDLSHSTATDEKVHIVTREEFEEERSAIEQEASPRPEPVRLTSSDAPAASVARSAEADAKQTASKAQQDAKQTANKASNEAEKTADKASNEAQQTANKAEKDVKQTANKAEKDVKQATETAKSKASSAYAEGEKKAGEAKDAAAKEYKDLSEKARKAYDRLSEEAKQDWHKLSKESKKRWDEAKNSEAGQELQKPEVWGSLLGVANLIVTGTTVYYAYRNWNKPRWDRRVVTGTVIGLATWFGVQGQAEKTLGDRRDPRNSTGTPRKDKKRARKD